jgi:hypothetical protein
VDKHLNLELEYTQINENFRFLGEIRFKLLALVPTFGGIGVFVLAGAGLSAGAAAVPSSSKLLAILLVSLFALSATLGITLYDQRNSELYNALIHRAKWLESHFDTSSAPGGLRLSRVGGQFNERPKKNRRVILKAGHDLALALIYGPLLGAWILPILYSALRLASVPEVGAQLASVTAATIAALASTSWLVILDRQEMQRYHCAAKRDIQEQ